MYKRFQDARMSSFFKNLLQKRKKSAKGFSQQPNFRRIIFHDLVFAMAKDFIRPISRTKH